MDDVPLVVIREAVTQLVQECEDGDLLDLVFRLLAEQSSIARIITQN